MVPVVVNGKTYRLRAFTYSLIIQNRESSWRLKESRNYVPVLGAPVGGDSQELGKNKISWQMVSVSVSDEVLENVKAAAVK